MGLAQACSLPAERGGVPLQMRRRWIRGFVDSASARRCSCVLFSSHGGLGDPALPAEAHRQDAGVTQQAQPRRGAQTPHSAFCIPPPSSAHSSFVHSSFGPPPPSSVLRPHFRVRPSRHPATIALSHAAHPLQSSFPARCCSFSPGGHRAGTGFRWRNHHRGTAHGGDRPGACGHGARPHPAGDAHAVERGDRCPHRPRAGAPARR